MSIKETGTVTISGEGVLVTGFTFDGSDLYSASLEALIWAKEIIEREMEPLLEKDTKS